MLKKLWLMIRAKSNATLSKAEQELTIVQMNQAYKEMSTTLAQYQQAVAAAAAYERRLKRQLDDQVAEITALECKAREAAKASMAVEALQREYYEQEARRALTRINELQAKIEPLKIAWTKARATVIASSKTFERAAEELNSRARQLNEARLLHQLNQARKEVLALTAKLDLSGSAAVFDNGLARIQDETDKIDALAEVMQPATGSIENQIDNLLASSVVDEQFQSLLKELAESNQAQLPDSQTPS